MFTSFTTRLENMIKHKNTIEDSHNTGLKDYIIFSCANKRQINGPTSIHHAMVNISPFQASFEPD